MMYRSERERPSLEPNVRSAQPTTSRVTRPLAVTIVSPGRGTLQAALNAASAGDELVLEDGNYTAGGDYVLDIGSTTCSGSPCDVIIRAQHPGMAVVDGEQARQGIRIDGGTVVVEGVQITRGYTPSVSARYLNFPRTFLQGPNGGTFPDISDSILTLRGCTQICEQQVRACLLHLP